MIKEDNNSIKISELVKLEKERKRLEKELIEKMKSTHSPFNDAYERIIKEYDKEIAIHFSNVFKEDDSFEESYKLTKGHSITAIDAFERALKKLNGVNEYNLVSIFKQILLELFHK